MSYVEFGTALYELWVAGNSLLPEVGDRFASANGAVEGTSNDQALFGHTMRVSPTPSITALASVTSPVFSHWDGLRDALQQAMAESANNTYACAEALLKIMESYAATDVDAKAVLDANCAAARNGHPLAPGVPVGSSDQSSGETKMTEYNFENRPRVVGRH